MLADAFTNALILVGRGSCAVSAYAPQPSVRLQKTDFVIGLIVQRMATFRYEGCHSFGVNRVTLVAIAVRDIV